MKLTLCDWQLALAAYAYENTDVLTMNDYTYDRLALAAASRGTQLPGFGSETGQWVHNMDQQVLKAVLEHALAHNDGKQDLHEPAIRGALDHHGLSYGCCLGERDCWYSLPEQEP